MAKSNCKCVICGKGIYKYPSEIKKSKTGEFTCSMEHYGELLRIRKLRKIEDRLGIDDFKGWLTTKYYDEQLGSLEISEIVYGTSTNSPNIIDWMERLGVPRRSRSEAIALQWEDKPERRKLQAESVVKNLGAGTPGREKLIGIMQTDEYKEKQRISKTGERNGMWNPDLTDEEREREKRHSRRYPGYQDFRKAVYERDGYACVHCGDDTGGNLVVHHLNGFHWDEGGRTEVDNGATLCNECHKEFHDIYGNRNNNLFQFAQFTDLTITE